MSAASLRALLAVLLVLLPIGGARAQRDEAQVKAAYVLNFLRFTEWPQGAAQAADGDAFVLAVVGTREFADTLRGIAREAEKLGQRPVRVRRLDVHGDDPEGLAAALAKAHAVFVQGDSPDDMRTVLQLSERLPVLTIGEGEDFARQGGMLALVPQGTRIVFDANPQAIQSGGLQVSAKVLKLANIVGTPR